jgi:hypothetical protein
VSEAWKSGARLRLERVIPKPKLDTGTGLEIRHRDADHLIE